MNTSGTAEVLLEGADDYAGVQEGMTLDAGDKIKTGSGASVELSFNEANTNVVRLNENTDASITLSGDEKMDVSSGEVFSSVSDLPSGSAFEIRTPTAVSGARGTDWVTKVSDDGTDVEAVDSVPYVRHFETSGAKSSQMTLIQPGQMTTVKRFQPPMQPRPMNPGRQQQWKAMKQQVRKRAGEAVIKRGQRPQFNRKDFIQQMKGRKEQSRQQGQGQGGFKALRSDDRPKGSFEQERLDGRDRQGQGMQEGQMKGRQEGQLQDRRPEGFKPLRSGDRPTRQQFQNDRLDQREARDVKPADNIQNIGNETKRPPQSGPKFEQKDPKPNRGFSPMQQGSGPGANTQGNKPGPKIPVAPPRPKGSGPRR